MEIQAGVKYVDMLGIDHLDGQAEFNLTRPYTYAHRDSSAIYSHFNMPLAHPLGANFQEYIFRLRYQPIQPLVIQARYVHMLTGEDTDMTNWGSNILFSTNTREMDIGNEIGQGVRTEIDIIGLEVRYELIHNLYLELEYFRRNKRSALPERTNLTQYIGGSIRYNIGKRYLDF